MFIKVRVEGISPVMFHRFSDQDQLASSRGSRASSAAADRGTPLEQAERCLHLSPDGYPIVPQPMIMGALINGGKFFKAGKSKITTQRSSLIPAAVLIEEPYFYLESDSGWKVDSRPVRNPSTGGGVVRHRAMFDDWAFEFVLELDVDEINVKLMREIVDAAGKKVGIGDFRPDRRGPYGRFVVTRWEESGEAFSDGA